MYILQLRTFWYSEWEGKQQTLPQHLTSAKLFTDVNLFSPCSIPITVCKVCKYNKVFNPYNSKC